MARRTDYLVRDRIQKTRTSLDEIFKKFAMLDDPDFLISATQAEIAKLINEYGQALIDAIMPIFTGKDIDRLTIEASRAALKDLRSYGIKKALGKSFEKRVAELLRQDYSNSITRRVNQVTSDLRSKVGLFRSIVNVSKFPEEAVQRSFTGAQITQMRTEAVNRAIQLLPRGASDAVRRRAIQTELEKVSRAIKKFDQRGQVTISGKTYSRMALTESFERASARYGRYDTVIYSNGNKFPLRAYVDTRLRTMTRDVRNTTTAMAAASTGVMTVRISSHGSSDSCQFWEGKIAFISQQAKDIYLDRFPDDSRAAAIPTLDEIRADATHMFGHGCLHSFAIYPIQFFSEEDRADALDGRLPEKLPAKIQEHRIIAETRRRRGLAA